MESIVILALVLVGLCMGSFVNAAVWRIKHKRNLTTERSECVHCHHKLAWQDLIPVVSWLSLKGKCRYCKKPIAKQYPIIELAVAVYFVLSYLVWPYGLDTWQGVTQFVLWLAYGVGLAILFVYDLRWFLLPDKVMFPLIALAAVGALVRLTTIPDLNILTAVLDAAYSLLPVAGLYYILHTVSKGQWVGFGDVKLGIFIGLALGWQLALVTLIVANLLGCLVVIPGLLSGRLKRDSRVPFGPLLIGGFIIAGLFGDALIGFYIGSLLYPI